MNLKTFRRVEQKYILSRAKYKELMKALSGKIEQDKYSPETICNIYFDSKNYDLIRESLEKPVYKEKIRLRSYETPTLDDKVYLEIKKKYDGIVEKRRIPITLKQAYDYINNKKVEILEENKQIEEELNYCFKKYNLKPVIYIAYDRKAYYAKDNTNFRITFDYNIRSREQNIGLENGTNGNYLTKKDKYIMEVKALNSFPLWFTEILTKLEIYPKSFSKYGEIYYLKLSKNTYQYA